MLEWEKGLYNRKLQKCLILNAKPLDWSWSKSSCPTRDSMPAKGMKKKLIPYLKKWIMNSNNSSMNLTHRGWNIVWYLWAKHRKLENTGCPTYINISDQLNAEQYLGVAAYYLNVLFVIQQWICNDFVQDREDKQMSSKCIQDVFFRS